VRRSLRRISATGDGDVDLDIRPRGGMFPVRTQASTSPGRYVVDAAVIAKWFVTEPHSEAARRLIDGHCEVVVPDLAFSELGSILQRRVTSAEMSDPEALSILQTLAKMPLQVHRTWPLGPIALELQRSLACGVYDCIHIALALRESAVLVTADRSLYEMLRTTPLSRYVKWITDMAPAFIS
jgi:predicted nucleic acid-binding protein